MYPLSDPSLTVWAIAEHWSRSLPQRPPPDEILSLLIQAFWTGKIELLQAAEVPLSQRQMLSLIHLSAEHPGFTVYCSLSAVPPEVEPQPDGGVVINPPAVVLPREEAEWSEAIIAAAAGVLATIPFDGYGHLQLPALAAYMIDRDQFGVYCDEHGFDRPSFWFRRAKRPPATAGAKVRCERWLREQVKGPKLNNKSAYFSKAKASFPNLSKTGFDEIWRRVAPRGWKSAGAPKGARHRKSARRRA
jgi:hypothetical protein